MSGAMTTVVARVSNLVIAIGLCDTAILIHHIDSRLLVIRQRFWMHIRSEGQTGEQVGKDNNGDQKTFHRRLLYMPEGICQHEP